MSKYLLIETKGPLDGGSWAFDLGIQLREDQHEVTVYLLQDGVFSVRRTFEAGARLIHGADRSGLRLIADAVSCRQRGIVGDRVSKSVSVADMDNLMDLLMEQSDKAIWH